MPGTSDNIRVISIVDRFLEHARIFSFENGGKREVYLSSADWMPRNFQRRVEVMFPVEDEGLRDRVVDEILGIALTDNAKARRLLPDGSYVRVRPDVPANGTNGVAGTNGLAAATHTAAPRPGRSQVRFMELAREKAHAAPALPGTSGGYHVRGTPLPRTTPPPPTTPTTTTGSSGS